MLSTLATAALINFLVVPISYHESEPAYTKNKLKIMMLLQYPNQEAFSIVSLIKL